MIEDCPFFRPSRSLTHDLAAVGIRQELTSVGVYCRLPDGRVRVPGREEVKSFCLPGRYRDCPHYRRHAGIV
jgi:hypothetical protein